MVGATRIGTRTESGRVGLKGYDRRESRRVGKVTDRLRSDRAWAVRDRTEGPAPDIPTLPVFYPLLPTFMAWLPECLVASSITLRGGALDEHMCLLVVLRMGFGARA